jgi:5'-nucleotidase
MVTLSTIDYDDIIYQDFIKCGNKLSLELKEIDKCNLIIALTHMRMYNDELLLNKVNNIDIILGGHDHDYNLKTINNKVAIKSGSDFKELSLIKLIENNVYLIEKYEIDSSIEENKEISIIVNNYFIDLEKELDVTLGILNIELEGRFDRIRKEETNLGNLICDIALEAVNADCCIINSGTFRSDTLHPSGEFKVRDLKKILPFMDTLVVIKVNGKQIYEALENGVSQYPKLEGRFPQISGIQFKYNPLNKCYKRVDLKSIKIQNELLDLNKEYKLATKSFIADGKDGYDMFKDCIKLIDDENGPELFTIVENHFKTIEQLKSNQNLLHRPSLVPLAKRNYILNELMQKHMKTDLNNNNNNEINNNLSSNSKPKISFHTASKVITSCLKAQKDVIHKIKESDEFKSRIQNYEKESLLLKPICENRIICLQA